MSLSLARIELSFKSKSMTMICWRYVVCYCFYFLSLSLSRSQKGQVKWYSRAVNHSQHFESIFSMINKFVFKVDQLSMLKSLIVRACVSVVHNGEWSTVDWNRRRRLLSRCRSFKHSALPFSLERFFFGQCDILLSVLLLLRDLRCPLPYRPLSKLFDRIMAPYFKLLRRFDILLNGCAGVSLDKRVVDTKGESFLLIDAWSSMPLTFMV